MRKPGYVSRIVQHTGSDADEVRSNIEHLLWLVEKDLRRGKEVNLKHFGRFIPEPGGIRFVPHPKLLTPLRSGQTSPQLTEAAV